MSARKQITEKLRFEVFRRDNYTCQYCGRSNKNVELQVDHIIPVSKGGTNDITNLITSCRECNIGKGNTELTDQQINKLKERNNAIEDFTVRAEAREPKSQRVQLLFTPSLHRKVKEIAINHGLSLNECVHQVLEQFCVSMEKGGMTYR